MCEKVRQCVLFDVVADLIRDLCCVKMEVLEKNFDASEVEVETRGERRASLGAAEADAVESGEDAVIGRLETG